MKAVVYDAPRSFSVTEMPDPAPSADEVVLRMDLTGVCGTDLHIHEGEFLSGYPLTPGHEMVGTVVSGATARLSEGTRVVADNTVLCGHCYFCRRDQPLFCRNFHSLGVTGAGGFAEFVAVKERKCFPAEDLPLDTAVMVEPTACAIHGMDVLGLRPGSDVLIFGSGPTGLVLAQLLVHGGAARVVMAAPTEYKLDMARRYGVDHTVQLDRDNPEVGRDALTELAEHGFDVVIDATGAVTVMERALDHVRDGGTFLVYGMAAAHELLPIKPYELFRRELTIKGSFAQIHCFDRSLAVLRSGRVRTEGIITHRFDLEHYGDALQSLRDDPTCLKAAIDPSSGSSP